MASIIPGYEYDIFISYRQKDNKYDGWVTEFVDNLKRELEATFKEEISVYFDINPHDGLLETHDVDASLKEKLKCLVFIPIISQTYCDPKSFAWEYEFKAFIEQASHDSFGLKVKLSNGNVANRILPVQIHDLESEDKTLLENELGGILRGIEFIYKSAGVNRPLKPSDNPDKNLNKTFYRDQVNKVANAIKEIITSFKKYDHKTEVVINEVIKHTPQSYKNLKRKLVMGSLTVLFLIMLGYFLIPRLSKSSEQVEKSIAVLPFTDMSPGKDQEYLGDGLADDIISALSDVIGLKVIGRISSFQFKGVNIDLREVGKKLDVSTVLEGSLQKSGKRIRITAQLISIKDGYQMWSEKWERDMTDIFNIQDEISSAITEKLQITLLGKPGNTKKHVNPDAYEAFLLGRYNLNKGNPASFIKAKDYFEKAIQLDPNYADAYALLSYTLTNLGDWIYPPIDTLKKRMAMDSSKVFAEKAISTDDQNSLAHIARSIGYRNLYDWKNQEKELRIANKLNPGPMEKRELAFFLSTFGQFNEAEELAREAIKIDPLEINARICYSDVLLVSRKYEEALEQIKKALDIDPNSAMANAELGHFYIAKKDYHNALLAWSKQHQFSGDSVLADIYRKSDFKTAMNSWIERSRTPEAPVFSDNSTIAYIYALFKDRENAIKYLELTYKFRSPGITGLKNYEFDFIRNDPRFIELYEKAGFKAYDEYKAEIKK